MPMAYVKTEWKARQGTNLNKFTKSQETGVSVILTNTPDEISEPGTPFSADNMNNIEQGIADAHGAVANAHAAIAGHMASSGAHADIVQSLTDTIALRNNFTFIIDSDDKLAAWAENAPGNDYSRILVKAGTWNYGQSLPNNGTLIDISNGRTQSVIGESGSVLHLSASISQNDVSCFAIKDSTGLDYSVFGFVASQKGACSFNNVSIIFSFDCQNPNAVGVVFYQCSNLNNCNVELNGTGGAAGFNFCSDLTSCKVDAEVFNGGFWACCDLLNCECSCNYNSYNEWPGYCGCTRLTGCKCSGYYVGGFDNCFNLVGCNADIIYEHGPCIVFKSCANLVNCSEIGRVSPSGYYMFGFSECSNLFNCISCGGNKYGSNYGFMYCITGFGNKAVCNGDYPFTPFYNCYMTGDGNFSWNETAEGGCNKYG